jgi:hypothetical protein
MEFIRTKFLAPLMKLLPLKTFGQIQDVADERQRFGTWRQREAIDWLNPSTSEVDTKHKRESNPAREKVDFHSAARRNLELPKFYR